MNRKQLFLTLSVAITSGVLGGLLSVWFLMPPTVLAQDEVPRVIEAQEFRVVDDEGRVRVRLGFGTVGDEGYLEETRLLFFDEKGEPRIQIRDYARGPFIQIQESGSGASAFLEIGPKPRFGMWNTQGGVGSRINLSFSNEGIPKIELLDQDNKIRAVLGTTELKNTSTGSTEIRAPSSLVLFDEEGKVAWSAP